ncbi:hypothetical protein [Tepidibacter sp. Z1-5]|uniref:hypothetical protein n=1 Tax=Tepidibacter sp. Z1-5 TaxID=3134138 RepID=UPI0030C4370B
MFSNKHPVFSRRRVLKLEMLDCIRDFPKDIVNIHINGYANGILTGCRLSVNDDYIIISPGIICFDEDIYILKENYTVPYTHTNETSVLKVKFIGENSNQDFVSYITEVLIDNDTNIHKDEIELCRFKLKAGAKLRNNYTDFEDMTTEYNTINIINSQFAAYENSTISPYVLKYFAKEAFKYKLSNPLDISFCMQCLQDEKAINKELIIIYISSRLDQEYEDYSNERIYKFLIEILQDIKYNRVEKSDSNYLSRKIILD